MELLEANQRYRLFTKNDRGVGTVIYHKQDGEEDIIFRPFFHEEGDPSIGVLYDTIKKEDWKTSRELFGRYLDDPHFRLGNPTISYVIRPEIKVPAWMGETILVLVEFDNDGAMTIKYGADGIGMFLNSSFVYKGEINLEETSKFAYDKIKEDAPRVEYWINLMPPPHLLQFFDKQEEEEDDDDELS